MLRIARLVLVAVMAFGLTACKRSPTASSGGGGGGTPPTPAGNSILTPSPPPTRFVSPDGLASIEILQMPGPGSQLEVGTVPPMVVRYWQDKFDEGAFWPFVSNDGVSLVAEGYGTSLGLEHHPFAFLKRAGGSPTSGSVKRGQTVTSSIGIDVFTTPGISGVLDVINFIVWAFGNGRGGGFDVQWIGPGPWDCQPITWPGGGNQCNDWQVPVSTGRWPVMKK
ncbi:MAG: hypothetical protein HYT68_00565 [Candidatus Zambryskibacteria bacterium]|nr:hypothetical protein [Candidatus Zambryskibacteria bacterium]